MVPGFIDTDMTARMLRQIKQQNSTASCSGASTGRRGGRRRDFLASEGAT
jgi:hypothetical protein